MMSDLPARVSVLSRLRTSLASWSLVQAELEALRAALQTTAEHIVVCSGADYPLVSVEQLTDELSGWRGRSHFWNAPIPYSRWDTPHNRTGGRWRFESRFLTRRDQVMYVRGIPLRVPRRRAIPAELELRASSQWKIYARRHAAVLLDIVSHRTDLVRFWRGTLVPEESFAASVLASPSLVGDDAIEPSAANAWYLDWPVGNTAHPRWLDSSDFRRLRDARFATADQDRKWFARKFSTTVDSAVLDRIDAELRV